MGCRVWAAGYGRQLQHPLYVVPSGPLGLGWPWAGHINYSYQHPSHAPPSKKTEMPSGYLEHPLYALPSGPLGWGGYGQRIDPLLVQAENSGQDLEQPTAVRACVRAPAAGLPE